MSYHCERCGTHLDDLATECTCDLPPTKAEIDRARIGHATPIMDAVIAERNLLAAKVDELRCKLDWAQQIVKAQEETSNGVACARERAAGNGGCGACSWCCADANAQVAARDEVITKLLAMMKPKPELIANAQMDFQAAFELEVTGNFYDRAVAIAEGRDNG